MAQPTFQRVKRLTLIYLVVQLFLLALLVTMAFQFQAVFRSKGIPQVFFNSIIASVVLQLVTFYPLKVLAEKEARREVAFDAGTLTPEELKGLRHSRMFYDFGKATIFLFFAAFIILAPGVTFVMSTIYFGFILVGLTYFQCFNFAARRAMRG
jgi:hypothetical protein